MTITLIKFISLHAMHTSNLRYTDEFLYLDGYFKLVVSSTHQVYMISLC